MCRGDRRMTRKKVRSGAPVGRREHSDDDDVPYEIGSANHPPAHRFQKGQSGNPAGSKRKRAGSKRAKSLKSVLLDELAQRIAVTEGGRRRQVPRQTALVKKLIAVQGASRGTASTTSSSTTPRRRASPTPRRSGGTWRSSTRAPSPTAGAISQGRTDPRDAAAPRRRLHGVSLASMSERGAPQHSCNQAQ